MTTFNIQDHGAIGDGKTNNTAAINAVIQGAAKEGGGRILVPKGTFVTGTVWLASGIDLHLAEGAMLLASESQDDVPIWRSEWEGENAGKHRALVSGEGLTNVSITGKGTLDGSGHVWWPLAKVADAVRPVFFRLVNSTNILIEGVTFQNSPMWTVTPLACSNVTVRNVHVHNPSDSPNTDGINPESCSNVLIEGCTVDVGDDCITLKSGTEDDRRAERRACENIVVRKCRLLHGHGGVVVGSETTGSVRNVVVTDCFFQGTDRGLRFKSRRGRGGVVENFRAENLTMEDVGVAIAVNLFYGPGAKGQAKITSNEAWPADATTPRFRDLTFSNISATKIRWAAAYFRGLPEMPVEDVTISDCSFALDPAAEKAGNPEMSPGIKPALRDGILATKVDGLTLRNVAISGQRDAPASLTDCTRVELEGFPAAATSRP